MLKIIHIKSTYDDGYIISGNGLCVEHGSINVTGDVVNIVLNDDGKITIPTGIYELLSIETDCGDFVIDLPECYFKKIEIKSDCGDMKINTNYKNISFDTECGEYENLNLHNKGIKPKTFVVNKIARKVKSLVSEFDLPLNKNKDRYF